VDRRRADERAPLRDIDRDPTDPRASARRHRHPRQCRLPQERARRRSGTQARCMAPVPAAIFARPEPDRDGLLQAQGAAAKEGRQNLRRLMRGARRHL
jgi:hypothetical protein